MRRKAVVPRREGESRSTSEITCVQFTTAPKSVKRWFVVGSVSTRTNAPPAGARQAIRPSRIRASPSVPIILTSGIARREGGAEHHAVEQVHDPAERDADDVREPVGTARVVDEVVGDQGARGTDGAERDVQHPGRLVEHDEADARERVGAAERQPEHDVRLEERPVHAEHRERR